MQPSSVSRNGECRGSHSMMHGLVRSPESNRKQLNCRRHSASGGCCIVLQPMENSMLSVRTATLKDCATFCPRFDAPTELQGGQ